MVAAGVVKDCGNGIKVLGNGELTKKLTVKAAAYSASAKEKIEKAGGEAEVAFLCKSFQSGNCKG